MKTLNEFGAIVNKRLDELLPEVSEGRFEDSERPWLLNNAMRYSLMAGGKRLRPSMLLAAVEALGGNIEDALDFACAVEMIHTYSLIHDDLPCMDNDNLRRGKPTNHVIYGEAQAMLAGDGLLNYAFEVMIGAADRTERNQPALVKAMREIAFGAGACGMVGGQCMDLYCEKSGVAGENELMYIHMNKTTRMFMHPLRAACYIANASEAELGAMTEFARAFGILFQVTDDILDVTGDIAQMGKTLGKDEESGKLTSVSVYGLDGAKKLADSLKNNAINALKVFGSKAELFVKLVNDTISRTK